MIPLSVRLFSLAGKLTFTTFLLQSLSDLVGKVLEWPGFAYPGALRLHTLLLLLIHQDVIERILVIY